jgi:hypothetical protein
MGIRPPSARIRRVHAPMTKMHFHNGGPISHLQRFGAIPAGLMEKLMKKLVFATAAVLSLASGVPLHAAENSFNGGSYRPGAGQPVITGGGRTVVTTGRIGSMQTTTLPGGAGQGFLMNNGNGTSTLIGPGIFSTMPTPR